MADVNVQEPKELGSDVADDPSDPLAQAMESEIQKDQQESSDQSGPTQEDSGTGSQITEGPKDDLDQEVDEETGVSIKDLSKDLGERDKQWKRVFTKKTQESSSNIKVMQGELDKMRQSIQAAQTIFQNKNVFQAAAKEFPQYFGGTQGVSNESQDLLNQIPEEGKKVLDAYYAPMKRENEQLKQYLVGLANEMKLLRLSQGGNAEVVSKKRDLINQYIVRGFSDDEAIKLATFDDQQALGRQKALEEVNKNSNRRIMKPGQSTFNSVPITEGQEIDTEDIIRQVKREHGVL